MHISYKNRLLWQIKVTHPLPQLSTAALFISATLYACAQRVHVKHTRISVTRPICMCIAVFVSTNNDFRRKKSPRIAEIINHCRSVLLRGNAMSHNPHKAQKNTNRKQVVCRVVDHNFTQRTKTSTLILIRLKTCFFFLISRHRTRLFNESCWLL